MHPSRMRTVRNSSHQLGGICLSACCDAPPPSMGQEPPPWVWAWRLPGCGPGDPPGCGSGDPPRCGLRDPPGQTPQAPPWVWTWKPTRHAELHTPLETCTACWDTTCKARWDTTPQTPTPPLPPPPWTDKHV